MHVYAYVKLNLSYFVHIRTQTVSRINKSLARKALYDNIYSDISENATEESVEALKKEIELIGII
jgi:hypothetical protein